MIKLLATFLLTLTLLSACGIYRMDIQQGNYITQEELSLVRQGMTQEQVRDILGTPLLTDDFRQNRWDYVFYLKEGRKLNKRTSVTIFFDQSGRVSNIRTG